jgi:phosphotransferase system enzyme I (PtsI)
MLLGLGLREFSMHPSHLLDVKQRVLQTDVAASQALVDRIRRAEEPDKLAALIDKLNA